MSRRDIALALLRDAQQGHLSARGRVDAAFEAGYLLCLDALGSGANTRYRQHPCAAALSDAGTELPGVSMNVPLGYLAEQHSPSRADDLEAMLRWVSAVSAAMPGASSTATTNHELDELTGLIHRRSWLPLLDAAASRAQSEHAPLAVLLCDLDAFKSINDEHGHDHGDQVLLRVARLFRDLFPDQQVCRIGGDEFAVMLSSDLPRAAELAERWRAAVEAQGEVTVTVGVASRPPEAAGWDGHLLLSLADQRLAHARSTIGRNVVAAQALPLEWQTASMRQAAWPSL